MTLSIIKSVRVVLNAQADQTDEEQDGKRSKIQGNEYILRLGEGLKKLSVRTYKVHILNCELLLCTCVCASCKV